MKNSVGSAKLEWGKGERTKFHTKDKGEELEEAFRDWKMHVHRDKDEKANIGGCKRIFARSSVCVTE